MTLVAHLDSLLLSSLAASTVAVAIAPLAMRLCRAIGWIDTPDARKQHHGPVPLAGGLTILGAVWIAGLVAGPDLIDSVPFWLSALMVVSVAFIDDRYPLRARYRFAAQLAASFTFVAMSGVTVQDLGALLGPTVFTLGLLGVPFAMIGITGLTNAVNMMDGLDGLAGGLMLVALCWLMLSFELIAGDLEGVSAALAADAVRAASFVALVVGALLGFLLFNQRAPWRQRAAMFLGDGGAMGLGFVLATMLVYASGAFGEASMPPVTAVWIAAVPLIDLFSSILRRILAGVTPMTPDRKHMHHLAIALGLTPGQAVVCLQAVSALTGLAGVVGWRLGVADYWMFWGILGLFTLYVLGAQWAWKRLDSRPIGDAVAASKPREARGEGAAR